MVATGEAHRSGAKVGVALSTYPQPKVYPQVAEATSSTAAGESTDVKIYLLSSASIAVSKAENG